MLKNTTNTAEINAKSVAFLDAAHSHYIENTAKTFEQLEADGSKLTKRTSSPSARYCASASRSFVNHFMSPNLLPRAPSSVLFVDLGTDMQPGVIPPTLMQYTVITGFERNGYLWDHFLHIGIEDTSYARGWRLFLLRLP